MAEINKTPIRSVNLDMHFSYTHSYHNKNTIHTASTTTYSNFNNTIYTTSSKNTIYTASTTSFNFKVIKKISNLGSINCNYTSNCSITQLIYPELTAEPFWDGQR